MMVCAAIGDVPLSVVYATNAKIEPRVKVVGAFPDNPHDPIVYPVAATVNAKPGTTQYLAFLRSPEATSIFEAHGFSALAKPTLSESKTSRLDVRFWHKADIVERPTDAPQCLLVAVLRLCACAVRIPNLTPRALATAGGRSVSRQNHPSEIPIS
jgi:hypothetical protein